MIVLMSSATGSSSPSRSMNVVPVHLLPRAHRPDPFSADTNGVSPRPSAANDHQPRDGEPTALEYQAVVLSPMMASLDRVPRAVVSEVASDLRVVGDGDAAGASGVGDAAGSGVAEVSASPGWGVGVGV